MRQISLLIGVMVLSLSGSAAAQLPIPGAGTPVQEVGQNLIYNQVQAANAVINTFQWLIDHASFETFALWAEDGTWLADLDRLRRILADGEQLAWDTERLQAQIDYLFGVDNTPQHSWEYAVRLAQIREAKYLAISYSVRTQSLLQSALGVLTDINQLAIDLLSILGVVNAGQMLAMQQSRLLQLQTELKVQTTAFQRVMMFGPLEEMLTMQFIANFNANTSIDMPSQRQIWGR
jgi:hypothetical protein